MSGTKRPNSYPNENQVDSALSNLESLPNDVLLEILEYLPTPTRRNVVTSSHSTNRLSQFPRVMVSELELLPEDALFLVLDNLSPQELTRVLRSSKFISYHMRRYFENKLNLEKSYRYQFGCPECLSLQVNIRPAFAGDEERTIFCRHCGARS